MDLDEYQKEAGQHGAYPGRGQNLAYPIIGLAGEAGEVCNAYKKILRARREPNAEDVLHLVEELGDVLWYAAAVAQELGWDLAQVAHHNLAKLKRRRQTWADDAA